MHMLENGTDRPDKGVFGVGNVDKYVDSVDICGEYAMNILNKPPDQMKKGCAKMQGEKQISSKN